MKKANKKGVSEIVSYVLLVVIAISISIVLYAFLSVYVPKEKPECKDGINAIINEVQQCKNQSLVFSFENSGRFKINALYVRLGNASRVFRKWINDPNLNGVNQQDFIFINETNPDIRGIFPGEIKTLNLPTFDVIKGNGTYTLEIQPAIFTKSESIDSLALCDIVSKDIQCTT